MAIWVQADGASGDPRFGGWEADFMPQLAALLPRGWAVEYHSGYGSVDESVRLRLTAPVALSGGGGIEYCGRDQMEWLAAELRLAGRDHKRLLAAVTAPHA